MTIFAKPAAVALALGGAMITAALLTWASAPASAREITAEDKAKCEKVGSFYKTIANQRDSGVSKASLQQYYRVNAKNPQLRTVAINVIEKVYGKYKDQNQKYIYDITKAECIGRVNNVNQ